MAKRARNRRGQFTKARRRTTKRKTARRRPAARRSNPRPRSNPTRRRAKRKTDFEKIMANLTKAVAVTGGTVSAAWLVNWLQEMYFPQLSNPLLKMAALAAAGLVIARFGGRFIGRANANSVALGAAVAAVLMAANLWLPEPMKPSTLAGPRHALGRCYGVGETFSNQQALPHQMGETFSNQQAVPHQLQYGGHMGRDPISVNGPFTGGIAVPGTVSKSRY